MTYEEKSIRKLQRRCLTAYAAIQAALYVRLRKLGDPGKEPLGHLHEIGFDVQETPDGEFHLAKTSAGEVSP